VNNVPHSNTAAKPLQQDPAMGRKPAAQPTSTAQMNQAPVAPINQPAQPQGASQPQAAPSAPADDGKAAAISSHRELLMLLDTRANSIKGSLRTMQQQQASSGLNMRGDIVTAQQRMELYLNEAEAALKSGDPAKGKKNLDSAEREIEKIEKFLGR
jgi:hypothetical protein